MHSKKTNKWLMPPLAALFVFAITFTSCTSPNTATPDTTATTLALRPSGTITEAGSTTIQPLAEKLANAFMAQNPEANIVILGGGSSVGIKSVADDTVDIGAASRPPPS